MADFDLNKFKQIMANAVKTAEHNKKNFGVLSVKTADPGSTLHKSVSNNMDRWISGQPAAPWLTVNPSNDKFVDFMQQRWAPIGAENDPNNLNANWSHNVRSAIQKQTTPEEYKQYQDMNLVQNATPPWMAGMARQA